MMPQSSTPSEAQINLILRFIEALHNDPASVPPHDLGAADIALARDLARHYPRLTVDTALRQRIWQQALAGAVRKQLVQQTDARHAQRYVHSNGRYARQETEPMFAQQPTVAQPMPRLRNEQRARQHQKLSRGISVTGLVAAIITLVIGGVLFAGPGKLPPSDDPAFGAGSPLIQQSVTPTSNPTAIPPMIQAVMDVDIRQGPGPEYPVVLTLTNGSVVGVIGRTEDNEWHQVLLPDGARGWIATPANGGSPLYLGFGAIDGVPVIGAAELNAQPFVVTATPLIPPPSNATATPVVPPHSNATATPLVPPPSSATATPMIPMPSNATPTLLPTVSAPPDVAAAMAMRLETWNVQQISEQLRLGSDSMAQLVWSSNGRFLAVPSENQVMLYESGDLRALPVVLEGHAQPIISLAYNPAGTILASSSKDGTVRLWDAQAGDLLITLRICDLCDVDRVTFNPDGSILIIDAQNDVRLWSFSQ